MSVRVSGGTLARGWLAVATASVAESTYPALNRTVYVEQFAHGLRLTCSDTYVLLTAWVPEIGFEDSEPVPITDTPVAFAVAQDPDRRAADLMGYLLKLARRDEEAKQLDLDVVVSLNVPWQAEGTSGADLQLDGFAALAVTVDYPDRERVQLTVYEGPFVPYRANLLAFVSKRPERLALSQRNAAALAKAAKFFGPTAAIFQRFGGDDQPILVTIGDDPLITGLVMPSRWDFAHDRPWNDLNPDDVTAGAEKILAETADDDPEGDDHA